MVLGCHLENDDSYWILFTDIDFSHFSLMSFTRIIIKSNAKYFDFYKVRSFPSIELIFSSGADALKIISVQKINLTF